MHIYLKWVELSIYRDVITDTRYVRLIWCLMSTWPAELFNDMQEWTVVGSSGWRNVSR